jgi:hypothetical protein
MEGRRLQEAQHAIIYCRPRQLHEVIDQSITPSSVRMQEAARRIKASARERLTGLPFEDGIGVVQDGVGGIYGVACRRLMRER